MIDIRGLRKTYKQGDVDVQALRGVDLKIDKGDFVAIVGPSGCGKSTLFNILGGLTPPSGGTVAIDGRDLMSMTDSQRTDLRKKAVGFVFQKYNLLPTLTVADNIEIARHIAGNRHGERDAWFEESLQLLGLSGKMDPSSGSARMSGRSGTSVGSFCTMKARWKTSRSAKKLRKA